VEIRLPPLRERVGDIPELITHFLTRRGRSEQRVTQAALEMLVGYAWPGNVRELENELERASILAGDSDIQDKHLSRHVRRQKSQVFDVPAQGSLSEQMMAAEREILRQALRRAGGNRTHAAKSLGLTRQGLVKKLARLGLGAAERATPTGFGDAVRRRPPR
jgi:DNA-binding NtrC family response regulator